MKKQILHLMMAERRLTTTNNILTLAVAVTFNGAGCVCLVGERTEESGQEKGKKIVERREGR